MQFRNKKVNFQEKPEEVAKGVFKGVCKIYDENKKKFCINSTNSNPGTIGHCSGLISWILLGNTFADVDIKKKNKEIENTIKMVIKEVDTNGFDVSPILQPRQTEKYFNPKNGNETFYYSECVSWVLSTMVQYRRAVVDGKLTCEAETKTNVNNMIKTCLERIVTNVTEVELKNGTTIKAGWGAMNRCTKPDLYFSFGIIESIADFADFILGEYVEKDEELINFLNKSSENIVQEIGRLRKNTTDWLIDTYGESVTKELIETPQNTKEKALYNTYFIIDMLILANADIETNEFCEPIKDNEVLTTISDGKVYSNIGDGIERKDIIEIIEHAVYFSRRMYDVFNVDDESNPIIYDVKWLNHPLEKEFATLLKMTNIRERGLKPLAVRINMLYVYYINRFPDRKITEIFNSLIKDRCDDGTFGYLTDYDLIYTVKGIEGLVDYYDYLVAYENYGAEGITPPETGTESTNATGAGTPITIPTMDELIEKKIENYLEKRLDTFANGSSALNNNVGNASMINRISAFLDDGKTSIFEDDDNAAMNKQIGGKFLEFILASINRNKSLDKDKQENMLDGYTDGINEWNKFFNENSIDIKNFFEKLCSLGTK